MNIPNGFTIMVENKQNKLRRLGNALLTPKEKRLVHFARVAELKEALRLESIHEVKLRGEIPKEILDLLMIPESEKEDVHPDAPSGLFYRDEFLRYDAAMKKALAEFDGGSVAVPEQLIQDVEQLKSDVSGTVEVGTRTSALEQQVDSLVGSIVEVNPLKWKGGNVTVFGNRNMGEIYEESRRLNLNTVTIPFLVQATSRTDSNPVVDENSWTAACAIAINMKNRGFRVIMEPFPYLAEGTIIETEWDPSNKATWFSEWKTIMIRTATFANDNNLDGMYIASNLVKMEYMSTEWSALIVDVKAVFSNSILYRTNWWVKASWDPASVAAYDQKLNNPLFGLVDIIAIAAYFELTDKVNPTKSDMMAALYSTPYHGRGQNVFEDIKAFHDKWDKPIYLGELGISPFSQAAMQPWSNIQGTQTYSEEVQRDWFSAWYEVFGANEWFKGYSIFTISDTSSEYRVSGRLAEKTIKLQDFGGNADRLSTMERKIEELFILLNQN